jgi:hypothetical protein
MWIKKENNVVESKELEYTNNGITKTDAYAIEITDAYLRKGADKESKSLSLCIAGKTEDDETVKTFFTILGRDGETYYKTNINGKEIKKQHIGLSLVNSLFKIVLGKEIFDVEPDDVIYKQYNKETKESENVKGDGFPDLIGKNVGMCVQMVREINGANSREYPEIAHFFDTDSGLFAEEEESAKTKLSKWLASAKDYKEVVKEEVKKSSFGKKEVEASEKPVSKWGKR